MNWNENDTVDNNQDSTANESKEALENKFNNETVSSDDARLEDEQSHGTVSTDDARLNGDQDDDDSLDGDDEFDAEDGDDTFDDLDDESTPQTPVNGSDDDEADLSTSGYDEDRTE